MLCISCPYRDVLSAFILASCPVPIGTRLCITRYKRTESSQCREKTTARPASRQGRDTKRIKQIHQKRDEKVCFLLPHVSFWHSILSLRIENPYAQWVWVANPDQRYGMEHPLDRDGSYMEHPLGRMVWRLTVRPHLQ